MPRVTNIDNFHIPAHVGGVQFTIGGATVIVLQQKINKHTIGEYWPGPQGRTHTGIATDNEDFKLYAQFGSAFEFEFARRPRQAVWMELEFAERELEASVMGLDVITQNMFRLSKVRVGASIQPDGYNGCIIYINHGPLVIR